MIDSRRYIISVCQCVVELMFHHNVNICYVPDTVVYNDFNDVRNGCSCNTKKPHYFAYIYCRRHLELTESLFPYGACRKATEICIHYNRVYRAACDNSYSYYKFFYLSDVLLICLKSSVIDTLLLTYSFHVFIHVDICNFFRQQRKILEEQWKSIDR